MKSSWLQVVSKNIKNNSTSIFSGIAVAGVVGTVVLAVRATPKACEDIAEAKAEWVGSDHWTENDKFPVKEQVKAAWRRYIPTVIAGTATIACIVCADQIGLKRNAAMFGAYTLVDTAFREYKDKVIEQIGEKKERDVTDDIHADRIARSPISSREVIMIGVGEQTCYDTLTDRYFKSDIESIRKAANDINATIFRDMYASQNDFYELIGLPPCIVGGEMGWNIDNPINVIFSSHLSECGMPCLAVGYQYLPRTHYEKI